MKKPKIRFKGYQEDWEQRKFGEIVEKYKPIFSCSDLFGIFKQRFSNTV